MPLTLNLRHLEKKDVQLQGDLTVEELDLAGFDELIEVSEPLHYDLGAERMSDSVLVRGTLTCVLKCQCVRCLTEFSHQVELMDWACDLPLTGEDRVPVVNDCVDLTPYLREDILLAFPQHPLCEPGCPGLPEAARNDLSARVEEPNGIPPSAWTELNKLKF